MRQHGSEDDDAGGRDGEIENKIYLSKVRQTGVQEIRLDYNVVDRLVIGGSFPYDRNTG